MAILEEIPVQASDILQPLIDTIQPILLKISLLVGGIFGIYVLLIFVRIYYERKKVKLLEDIRYDLDKLNIHYNIPYSKHKRGFLKKLIAKLK